MALWYNECGTLYTISRRGMTSESKWSGCIHIHLILKKYPVVFFFYKIYVKHE